MRALALVQQAKFGHVNPSFAETQDLSSEARSTKQSSLASLQQQGKLLVAACFKYIKLKRRPLIREINFLEIKLQNFYA